VPVVVELEPEAEAEGELVAAETGTAEVLFEL
jgi:hypothetical protein